MPRLAPALALIAATLAAPVLAKPPEGVWQNPKGNVRVQFRDCGGRDTICGRVVWANADAQAKAGQRLVGTDLFQGFVPSGRDLWAGSVLIPDIGQSVSGTITRTGLKTLVGEGCLFAGYGCKQQVWTQVSRAK